MTYRMIVKTETAGPDGRPSKQTERIEHIPAAELESRREAARMSSPRGAVRTIKVVSEN
jgi:hypothetical protein